MAPDERWTAVGGPVPAEDRRGSAAVRRAAGRHQARVARGPHARASGGPPQPGTAAMTVAGVHQSAPGATPAPVTGPAHGLLRLAWLYLVSRRVPAAAALLAGFGALLWAALFWHWNVAGGAAAQLVIPLVTEAGAAAVIAVTTYGPFG